MPKKKQSQKAKKKTFIIIAALHWSV